MKQDYLEELINFSNKDKLVTKELIEKIINEVACDYRFNGVVFGDTNWSGNVMCTCDITSRDILVDYEKLKLKYYKNKQTSLQKNLIILGYLFHEVNHLKEENIIKLLNFESLLISYSGFDLFFNIASKKLKNISSLLDKLLYERLVEIKQEQLYLKIYDKIPGERIANIRAYKEVLETICNYPGFKEQYKDDFKFINYLYVSQYYVGYDKYKKSEKYYKGPLLDYLKFIKMPHLLDNFDFYCEDSKRFIEKTSKEFTIEERMLYGLPVTLQETKELNKKLIITK